MVTVGIGGNDIGFSGIIEDCATVNPFGRPCRDDFVRNGQDEISNRIRATAPKVGAVIRGIRARSPYAAIFVVGYPAILPNSGIGCWPQMPLAFADVATCGTRRRSSTRCWRPRPRPTAPATSTPTRRASASDACKGVGTRWVEPIVPANPAAPVHPNARGMQGMGGVTLAAIRAAGF